MTAGSEHHSSSSEVTFTIKKKSIKFQKQKPVWQQLSLLFWMTWGHVPHQARSISKGHVAVGTRIRTLSSVNAKVNSEMFLLCKGWTALATGKGTLSGVDTDVPLEVAVLRKRGRAEVTLKDAPAFVFVKVSYHVSLPFGHVSALPAGMKFAFYGHEWVALVRGFRRQVTCKAKGCRGRQCKPWLTLYRELECSIRQSKRLPALASVLCDDTARTKPILTVVVTNR